MRGVLRRRPIAAARVLAVVLTIAAVLPFAAHVNPPDDVCDGKGRSTSQIAWERPGDPSGSPHCNLCHWLRALSACDTACVQHVSISPTKATAAVRVQSAIGIIDVGGLPARAPPA